MNDERLYLNGQQVDLSPSSVIAKTLQVNDIASMESRQSNFTRNIKIPMTPKNIQIFGFLGVMGSNSNIPYERITADYFIGNECLIRNGWAKISETTDTFNVSIYDGIVDFYKTVSNRTFADIELSGLTHDKTLTTVLDSWTANTAYKYIVADYGGKVLYDTEEASDIINIDYLVPSVNVKWLWDQTFNHYGFTYSGSVFETEDFANLYMTFPKGLTSTIDDEPVFETNDITFPANGHSLQNFANTKDSAFMKINSWSTNELLSIEDDKHLHVAETSQYRVQISGKLKAARLVYFSTSNEYMAFPTLTDVWLCKNADSAANADSITPIMLLASDVGSTNNFDFYEEFSNNVVINLQQGESICIIARSNFNTGSNSVDNLLYVLEDPSQPVSLTVSKVTAQNINFENALAEFKIKDFILEIIWRYGLTIFKDKYSDSYEFLTLKERLTDAHTVNWTAKYQKLKSEKYVFGDYAQANHLRYTYNDTQNTHKDGLIEIQNVNLEESKNIIASKIYAPELETSTLLPSVSNVYKLWNAEINESEGAIKYKALDKRFYFLKSVDKEFSTRTIGSEQVVETTTISSAPCESFAGLSFQDVVQNYYSEMSSILDKAKLLTAVFYLTPLDVANFDFKQLYYVAQLGGYFIVNKINNFRTGHLTDVELIKIDYNPSAVEGEIDLGTITITSYFTEDFDENHYKVSIYYTTTLTDPELELEVLHPGNQIYSNTGTVEFIANKDWLESEPRQVHLENLDGTVVSNEITISQYNL